MCFTISFLTTKVFILEIGYFYSNKLVWHNSIILKVTKFMNNMPLQFAMFLWNYIMESYLEKKITH